MKITLSNIIIRGIAGMMILFLMIFSPAGRLNYWQGWLLYGCYILLVLVTFRNLIKNHRDLFEERMKPGPGMKWWDKIFFVFFIPLNISIFLVGGLDSGRFFWTHNYPIILYVFGIFLFFLSNAIVLWAMYTNKFFSSVVRIQTDRGQTVVQEGPYKFIRHPGYIGAILFGFSVAFILGSYYALIPAFLYMVTFIVRTYLEDEALKKELEGYQEYTKKVRYRLIPFIW